jgi:act minimal PKS acyl carrier protein
MSQLTLDELRGIIRDCAGVADGVDVDGDIVDTPFDDLGYDSLAIFEFAAELERRYGLEISDGEVARLSCPRAALCLVNLRPAAA